MWTPGSSKVAEDASATKSYSRHGAFVDGAELFDNGFFQIAAKQVSNMPVSERWGLEVGYAALFNAGYSKQSLRRLKGDVLVGLHTVENQLNFRTEAAAFGLGGSQAREANLLSFHLNLTGQSIVLDTDGSSSLAAMCHAQMEQSAEQEEPLVCGRGAPFSLVLSSFWNVSPACFVNFSLRNLLSRRGRCWAFDANADGFVRGEASGALVMARLFGENEEASNVREGLIRASEMAQSGAAANLTRGSLVAMQELLDVLIARSECRLGDIDWVEVHAAGSSMVDALEALACDQLLRKEAGEPSLPLPMTNFKACIGSAYPAAGLLGLLRSLHCARWALLPSSSLRQLNPYIATEACLFPSESLEQVEQELGHQTGLAVVNSFGSSGTYCSVLFWADVGEALNIAEG